MSNKFLNSGSSANLSNGSVSFFGASLGAVDLDPSQPVKTNSTRQLYSTKLEISDINNLSEELKDILLNPLQENLDMNGYRSISGGDAEYNKAGSKPSASAGTLKLYANGDGSFHQIDEAGVDKVLGDSFDQSLNKADPVEFKQVEVSGNGTDGVRFRTDGSTNTLIAESYLGGVSSQMFGGNSVLFGIQSQTTIMGVNGSVYIKNCRIGDFLGANWSLPNARGANGQILQTDGGGQVSWVNPVAGNPFDQSLNSVDFVDFQAISVDLDWDIKRIDGHLEFRKTLADTQYFALRSGGFTHQYGSTGSVGCEYKSSRGTITTPTASGLDDEMCELLASGHDGVVYIRGGELRIQANQNWAVGQTGCDFKVRITPINTTGDQEYLKLSSTGLTLGAGATPYTLPVVRATQTYSALVDSVANGGVAWVDLKDSWGQIYFDSNAILTTFSAINTYSSILGNWITPGAINSGISSLGSVMTYNRATPRVFKLECSGDCQADDGKGTDEVELGFFVSGGLIQAGQARFKVGSGGDYPVNFSFHTLINLSAGDFVQVRAKNLSGTGAIRFTDISFTAHSLGV